ncbi:MAG: nitrogen regulation protein NR(I), partial [Hydrogenophaga sp.]|nr:nitrogen regulation protein NR(I) [Hydrogenophaga sp.]
ALDGSSISNPGNSGLTMAMASPAPVQAASSSNAWPWELGLQTEAAALLKEDRQDVWDVLSQRFEGVLIQAALAATRGRRIEAAVKLGIGRNTITRKIQELKLDDSPEGR